MIQFNDRKNATHELLLSVHDSGPGWNVWLATVEGDTRYFEAADDLEVWDLIDLAVHCYDEEKTLGAGLGIEDKDSLGFAKIVSYLNGTPANRMDQAGARAEMFKEYIRAGQELPQSVEGVDLKRKEALDRIASRDLSEMNAPKMEYPALYRKLLSPEEFTD